MAVALLVAEGRVSWQDDIRKYVPEVPNFDPGAEYLYSNTGFTLLAVVVERVSGESLRAFTTKRIFEPLGMTSTHFHDDHNMVVPNRAYGYAREGDGYRLSIPDFDVVGATSLFTTAEDMAKWDRNFVTAQVGGRAVVDDLLVRGVLTNGETIAYAAGRPMVILAPDRFRVGDQVFQVIDGPGGPAELRGVIDGRERLLRRVADAPPDAESRVEYAGTYWSDDLGVDYRVELADDRLQIWNRKLGARRLTPRALDRYVMGGRQLTFTRDGAGRVDGFTMSSGRVRKIRFDRR